MDRLLEVSIELNDFLALLQLFSSYVWFLLTFVLVLDLELVPDHSIRTMEPAASAIASEMYRLEIDSLRAALLKLRTKVL